MGIRKYEHEMLGMDEQGNELPPESTMHESTFGYLKPTDEQFDRMQALRMLTAEYANKLDQLLDAGADKTYILRKVREIGMWVNVSVTREADGTPRT